MLNLIIKDFLIQKKAVVLAIFYILFFIIVFQSIGETMFAPAIIAFTYILVMGAFAYDDKNKADLMINSLPIRRVKVVMAKYVSIFVYLVIGTAAYIIIYNITTMANIPLKVYPVTFEALVGAVLGVSLMNSIHFPLLFRIGYTKARIFNLGIFFAFFFGFPWLGKLAKADNRFIAAVRDFSQYQSDAVIGLSILAVTLVILLASYSLSIKFYKQRDF